MFSFVAGDGKDGVSPSTTHLTSQNFDCFIFGGDFVLSHIRYYLYISSLNKEGPYYSLSQIQYNYSSGASDGKGSSGTSTTYISHKVDFGR